jgi:hypothetical protein
MRGRIRIGGSAIASVGVLLCLLTAAPAQARAVSAFTASLGPAPEACTGANFEFGACVVQTRLGTLSLSPHVVHAGGVLTGTVGLTGNYPISWPDVTASPSGSFNPGLSSITPCKSTETTCQWKISAGTPSSTSWQFIQVGITNNQGTGVSREYFAILGKDEFELSGKVSDVAGAGVPGVQVLAKGPETTTATTGAGGSYSMILKRGTYTVTPTLAKQKFSPRSSSVSLTSDRTADFSEQSNVDKVSVSVDSASLPASGFGQTGITITDQNAEGEPVEGQTVKISPPLSYEVPALVCDSTGRLAYPSTLNDGSVLGSSFQRITDGSGQIHLTGLFGAVPGSWLIEAGEPTAPLSGYGHASVDVTPSGGSPRLPDALASLLIAAAEHNVANLSAEPQRNVLEWLGRVQGEIGGLGFLPIHSVDAAGSPQAGVVIYANTPAVRDDVMDYLRGSSTNPPGEEQAVVIDIASVRQLRIGSLLAGHPTDQVPYRLPSIGDWANGTTIQISTADQGFFNKEAKIPIPARGRPEFGFAHPSGAENLIYGYGPYPPLTSELAQQELFNRCVTRQFSTSITPHSPVTVTVTDASGKASGLTPAGVATAEVPGSIVSSSGKVLRGITMPEGSYKLKVTGTGSGPATLVIDSAGGSAVSSRVFHFRSARGKSGTISITTGRISSSMRFGGHVVHASSGLTLKVGGLPRKLARHKHSSLELRVREQLGHAAAGVTVTATGVAGKHITTAGPNGVLSLRLTPARRGKVKLTFSGPGYARLTRTISVR